MQAGLQQIQTQASTKEDLLSRIDGALSAACPEVQAWATAQIEAVLSEIPFRKAALSPPLILPKETLPNRLLTPHEAANLLNIPVRWIYRHGKKMPHRRLGRYLRFPERDLLKWAEKQQQGTI